MMKRFLASPLARRLAWLTLVAVAAGLFGPGGMSPAAAAPATRSAYMVPLTGEKDVPAQFVSNVGSEVASLLMRYRSDARVRQPIDVLPVLLGPEVDAKPAISGNNLVYKRALEEGVVKNNGATLDVTLIKPTGAEPVTIANPPVTLADSIVLCQGLNLGYVINGSITGYKETPTPDTKGTTGELSYEIFLSPVPAVGGRAQAAVMTIAGTTRVTAHNETEKVVLKSSLTERAAKEIASKLLDFPELAPPPPPPAAHVAAAKKADLTWVYIAVPVALVALIFGISSVGGSKSKPSAALAVTNVAASSEQDSVRITWTQAAAAVGYNVYRRAAGSQPVHRSVAPRGRQTTGGFELLPNPQTNSVPTVVGGNRTSFIDTTALSGTVYEYAVAGVSSNNTVGALSTPTVGSRSGPNIGSAPVLTASAGNAFVSLTWTASSAFVSGYFIYRRKGGFPDTGVSSPDVLATVGNVTTFDDTTAANGLEYTYVVQPYTQVGNSQRLVGLDSNRVTIAPLAGAPPQAPRNVAAVADSLGFATVTWTPNAEPVASYEVLRLRVSSSRAMTVTGRNPWVRGLPADMVTRMNSTRSNPRTGRQIDLTGYSVVGTVANTVSSFREGPLPDGVYRYAVRAVSTAGVRGPVGLASDVAVSAPPAAPAGLAARGTNGAVVLSWQTVAGNIATYRIYRSTSPITAGMTGPATAPGIARVTEVDRALTGYTDTGVTNNTTYYYAVTAVSTGAAESLFGKGSATSTGAVAVPHSAPATMTLASDKPLLAANGIQTAAITLKAVDAASVPVPGVDVTLTTDRGSFASPLPANASYVDTAHRQVRVLTDATGQVAINFLSEVVVTAATQTVANIQARASELPVGQQVQSVTVAMQASVPNSLLMSPPLVPLTADGATTANIAAKVLDGLGQPVPDGNYSVSLSLSADNGELRQAGDVQQFPFQRFPTVVTVPVVGGQAQMVYRAGRVMGVLQINAVATNFPSVSSSATIQLKPGPATQLAFSQAGTGITQLTLPVGTAQTVQVDVRDAQGNRVGAGVAITLDMQPTGVVTTAASGTTDANGQLTLNLTAGAAAGDASLTATVGTSTQGQLTLHVR